MPPLTGAFLAALLAASLAEMGCLVRTAGLVAAHRAVLPVVLGTLVGNLLLLLPVVLWGEQLLLLLTPRWLRWFNLAAGVFFIFLGLKILWSLFTNPPSS